MRPAHLSEAWQCIELGPGQNRPSFDARLAPQLPADHLRRHADTLCRSSTPAALPREFVDSTLSAAAGMMPALMRLAASQPCECAVASKHAAAADGHRGSVHPWGTDARPVARPDHVSAVLDDDVEPGARLWLAIFLTVDGQHAGTRAAIARRSHICVIDVC